MAKQTIQIGTTANDGTGDPLRTAFTKTNANFTELYTSVAALQSSDADLTAIAALTGTTGFLKKTAANTWALDTSTYLTGITSSQVITALGYAPYNGGANSNGYLTGITSSQVISALGFTPYSAANPNGYTNIPAMGGNAGKVLSTDGTSASWLSLSSYDTITARNTALSSYTGSTTITTLGTISAGTWNGGVVGVTYGGTGVATSSGANSVVLRDANQNITVNSVIKGFSNVTATGTTTTLTIASVPDYVITGSGGQTIKLPDATTLANGVSYTFNNNQSSGTIVVQNNSSTTVATIQSGGFIELILLSNSTAAGSWDIHNFTPSNVSWSTNTFDYAGSITNATWNGTAVAPNRGGTGVANNTASTLTISGAYGTTLTVSGTTSLTLPTTGTLATLAGAETLTNKTLTTPVLGVATATSINKVTITAPATGSTLTLAEGSTLATLGSFSTTLTATAATTLTLPTTGTLATLAGAETFTNKTLTSPVFGNATSTTDADAVVDASTTTFYSYVQSATTTARTINISNLIAGKQVTLYLRNTNAGTKVINIAAGTATSYSAVNMSKGDAGGTSVTSVTLAATSGTSTITVFNAGGVIGGSIS
jgi:hypothetical protein